jgi:hypothetical protein
MQRVQNKDSMQGEGFRWCPARLSWLLSLLKGSRNRGKTNRTFVSSGSGHTTISADRLRLCRGRDGQESVGEALLLVFDEGRGVGSDEEI